MKMETPKKPMIRGHIKVLERDYYIYENNWFGLIKVVDKMMKDATITYPVGEDEETKHVTRKVSDVEKFR